MQTKQLENIMFSLFCPPPPPPPPPPSPSPPPLLLLILMNIYPAKNNIYPAC